MEPVDLFNMPEQKQKIAFDSLFEPKSEGLMNFASLAIGIASPEKIKSWSFGKVKKPETINYRTFRPERDGLFCEKIFGPTKDWECFCGKYKSIRYKGVICDRCGVEVTRSEVRRHRMGHIDLVCPVSHIWYFKRVPSQMALLLDITVKNLELVLYFEGYIVMSPGDTPLAERDVLTEDEYRSYREKFGDKFKVGMGAEAVKELLKGINTHELAKELRKSMKDETSTQKRKRIIKRLELIESFCHSDNKPEYMILDIIPVIPPELRPMVQLDGGRFATSDLNDLYRRVINRNNRLERLMELRAPDIIIRNEKRMLQEAVDALLDNGRRGRPVRGSGNRPLKSLSDILKGKQGRFRQNLLGKRVDYSGRSVIVVDPTLKLHQCGLPKKMALELFKPFIMRQLVINGFAHNIKNAKRMVEKERPEVWDVLEKVIIGHPIMLNRAPTLHRAGIQSFEPILVEGDALKIHPLVCTAFNADFDGDQMAVHVPLSMESQIECRLLMLAAYNLLSPANGKPIVSPTQDIVLGIYCLTKAGAKDETKFFASSNEALMAYDHGYIKLNTVVTIRINGQRLETTVGRTIFNKILPKDIEFVNEKIDKKLLSKIIADVYRKEGIHKTGNVLDAIKDLGFQYATRYGVSIGMKDILVPDEKEVIVSKNREFVKEIIGQHQMGVITEEERYNKTIDLWTTAGEEISNIMFEKLSRDANGFNPIYLMIDSGARGSKQQVRQLAGMRGLMAKPSGEIIELPITSNFREGLTILEYFISTHGARKGLADTALKTADAGYLTRRLVDVSQDVIIVQIDCHTLNGVIIEALMEGDEVIETLGERVLGRVTLEDVINPMTGEVLVKANSEIDEAAVIAIEDADVEKIKIRTVLTCEARKGVCAMCYGRNLASGRLVDLGEAVGIIAAQSIGEPGTQLTMRTFHIGGTAYRQVEEREINLPYAVEIVDLPKRIIQLDDGSSIAHRQGGLTIRKIIAEYNNTEPGFVPVVFDGLWVNVGDRLATVSGEDGETTPVLSLTSGIVRIADDGKIYVVARERVIPVKTGTHIFHARGDIVPKNTMIVEFDPYNELILSDTAGIIRYKDIVQDRTLCEEFDSNTGLYRKVIVEDREAQLQPTLTILVDGVTVATYIIPNGARLVVNDGETISAGDVLAKFPQELIKTKDITGGLPRVAELFEARRPKNSAIVAEIDGVVRFKEIGEGKRTISVVNDGTGDVRDYDISLGKHMKVHDGDIIRAGDQLTDGDIEPHDILRIKGDRSLQEYLVNEIQEVYRLQGVDINDKHIEVIIRQMLRKVEVVEHGDTTMLVGEHVDKFVFTDENEKTIAAGGKPAKSRPIFLGVTKASLGTDSFISAASFQETTRILTEAAICGMSDDLSGLKENVVIGRLVPAGTGLKVHQKVRFECKRDEFASNDMATIKPESDESFENIEDEEIMEDEVIAIELE
ncbi:MAG: DNA-directed RNA polymerase subunit beta' [bacterium]|nr:DNA-directed RNA polymerase subunit beta' [bacterium]